MSLALALFAAPAAAAPKVVTLGTDTSADADAAEHCRALAGAPFEQGQPGGVSDDQIFLDAALTACEAAHAAKPESAEVATWLGRVYLLVGRAPDAAALFEAAAGEGNGVAQYLLSRLLVDSATGVGYDEDRSLQLLRQSADIGYAPAALDLGKRYEAGDGVDLDFVEARRLYELASGQGLGMATYKLAYMAHAGTDSASDFDLAMRLYRQATDQGEPSGWDGIGQLYQFGQGVDQDYAKAAEAYQHGADAGEQMSEAALGYLYEQGLGVTKDLDQAFALMTASADQGYGPAQANLALYYLFGEGTPADPDRAYPLIWQAIGKGAPGADGILGYMYAEGLGTDRDLDSALLHFQTGADNGDEYAAGRIEPTKTELACEDAAGSTHEPGGSFHGVEFEAIDAETAIAACKAALEANPGSVGDGVWLARAYLKAGEASEALPLLEAGTKAGNVLALFLYAELLIAGDALAADPARAIALYDQAAAKTFAPALMALGRIYASGEIVPPDVDKAADYFERAYEAGLDAAKAELTALREGTDISASSELAAGFGEEGPAY